ncbi:MAG: hypothetical protein ACREV8_01290 [Gammaproteobacteria bacterium]
MNGQDPGWKPLWKLYARALIPGMGGRRSPSGLTRLSQMRLVWLTLVNSLFSFFIVLNFVAPWEGDAWPFAWAIILLGVAAVGGVVFLRRRPLKGATSEALLDSFIQRFYVSFAWSETPALLGFVGVFLRDARWLYLVGAPFALAGLVLCGPLRSNIERYDRMLRESGSPHRLSDVLAQPVAAAHKRPVPKDGRSPPANPAPPS